MKLLIRCLPAAVAVVLFLCTLADFPVATAALFAAPEVRSSGATRTPEADALYDQSLEQDDVRAIKTLLRARPLAPRDERITYRIGFLFHKMNRRPEARSAYEDTIALQKCHTRALNNLGNILTDQGDRDAAIARYKQAIQCDDGFSVAHYNLANLYRENDELTAAVKHYDAALATNPDHFRSHHNLGLIYLRLAQAKTDDAVARKKYGDLAETHFGRACELNPKDAVNFYNRGRLYEMYEDRARAVSDYKRSLSLLKTNSAFKTRLRQKIQALEVPRR